MIRMNLSVTFVSQYIVLNILYDIGSILMSVGASHEFLD